MESFGRVFDKEALEKKKKKEKKEALEKKEEEEAERQKIKKEEAERQKIKEEKKKEKNKTLKQKQLKNLENTDSIETRIKKADAKKKEELSLRRTQKAQKKQSFHTSYGNTPAPAPAPVETAVVKANKQAKGEIKQITTEQARKAEAHINTQPQSSSPSPTPPQSSSPSPTPPQSSSPSPTQPLPPALTYKEGTFKEEEEDKIKFEEKINTVFNFIKEKYFPCEPIEEYVFSYNTPYVMEITTDNQVNFYLENPK
jgi:translation initiation factor 4G